MCFSRRKDEKEEIICLATSGIHFVEGYSTLM